MGLSCRGVSVDIYGGSVVSDVGGTCASSAAGKADLRRSCLLKIFVCSWFALVFTVFFLAIPGWLLWGLQFIAAKVIFLVVRVVQAGIYIDQSV